MKHESGVHRVQRIPMTEGAGRIHTSTMTVAILPQPSEVGQGVEQWEGLNECMDGMSRLKFR